MRRTTYRPFIVIAVVLVAVLTAPYPLVELARSGSVGALSPAWRWVGNLRGLVTTPFSYVSLWFSDAPRQRLLHLSEETERLLLENHLLNLRVDALEVSAEQDSIVSRWSVEEDLEQESTAIVPARVIYRNPGSWGSSLWISVGEEHNAKLPSPVIARNSPVVYGDAVVGVIDYVGKRRSRIRLITDSGLRPSVRALRVAADGSMQLLAKGEVQGQSQALWRQGTQVLDGIGFNYDRSDEHGAARDLRTGDVIREGDLLVTTGMDGVFPKGLSVARVTHVKLLREGAYYYTLSAEPTAPNLSDLSIVFVLPSRGLANPDA